MDARRGVVAAVVPARGGETEERLEDGAAGAGEGGEARGRRREGERAELGGGEGQGVAAEAEGGGLTRVEVVHVQQPTGAPPEKGFHPGAHLAGLKAEAVSVGEVRIIHLDAGGGVATVNAAIVQFLGEGTVERPVGGGGAAGEGERHASAVGEFAPFPRAVA